MAQVQKNKTGGDDSSSGNIQKLRKEFEESQQTPRTRVVKLKYQSCCGCGCDTTWIKRTVPYDSTLKDGDDAVNLQDDDEVIEDED